jgi:hypothetical protein
MNPRLAYWIVPGLVFLFISVPMLTCPPALSATDTYELSWRSIDGGGTMNAGEGDYSLSGTIGQPDAWVLSGGSYSLIGGFWGIGSQQFLFLPSILKN